MRHCLQCDMPLEGGTWHCLDCDFSPLSMDGIPCFSPDMLQYNDGYDERIFSEYERIVPNHFWFIGRLKLIVAAIRAYCPDPTKMLEIGCGSGHVLEGLQNSFPGAKLTGAEPSVLPLKAATHRLPRVTFVQLDGRNLPFTNEFDVIGAFDVLEHIDEDELALENMRRACKAGGSIVLTVPQHRWLWSKTDDIAMHKRRYDRQELVHKVTSAGFDVKYVSSFMSLLLPAMLISRAIQNYKGPAPTLLDEGFAIGPVLNRFFSVIFDIERAVLSTGVPLPVGGSLLLVAKKKKP